MFYSYTHTHMCICVLLYTCVLHIDILVSLWIMNIFQQYPIKRIQKIPLTVQAQYASPFYGQYGEVRLPSRGLKHLHRDTRDTNLEIDSFSMVFFYGFSIVVLWFYRDDHGIILGYWWIYPLVINLLLRDGFLPISAWDFGDG